MRHSLAVLSAALVGGVAITAGFGLSAFAQSASLQPKGGWAVTRIEASADNGAGAYCTLARQYDDGTILTLGRNATEEYSLAVDFQKPLMDPDRAYKLTLQPGPGQIRAYEMMPASPTAMVIRLGWDESFFEALDQSQTLKLDLEESSYSFSMPEISRGQADLKSCMEGLQEDGSKEASAEPLQKGDVLNAEPGVAAKGFAARKSDGSEPIVSAEIAAPATQVTAEDLAPMNIAPAAGEEIKDAADMPEIRSAMLDDAPSITSGKAPRPSFARQPRTSKAVIDAAPADKKEDVIVAEYTAPEPEEVIALAPEPEVVPETSQKQPKENADTVQKNDKEIAALKSDNERLRKALEQSQQSSTDSAEVAKQLAAQEKRIAEQEERIRLLEGENSKLLIDVRDARSQIDNAVIQAGDQGMKKARELEAKLEAAKADNQALAVRMEELTKAQEDIVLSGASGDWDLEQATKRFNESDREIRRLGMQLEQERMSCRQEKANLEGMLFDPAVADKAQIQRLMQMEEELTSAQAQIKEQDKVVEAKVKERTKDLQDKIAALETAEKSAKQEASTLQTQVLQKQAELSLKEAELTKAKGANQEVAALEARLSQRQAELNAKDSELAQVKAAVTTKDAALTQKQAALEKAQAEPKVDPKVLAEAASLKAEVASLREQLNSRQQIAAKAQDETGTLREQVASLKMQLEAKPKIDETAVKELAAIKAERDSLANHNNVLKQDVDKMKLQIGEIQTRTAGANDKTASLQLENEDLKRQLGRKENEARTFQNQVTVMKDETAQLKMRLSAADANQQSAAEAQSLKQEVNNLKAQVSQMENSYKDRISSLERDRTELERSLNNRAPAAGAQTYTPAAVPPSQPAPRPVAAQPQQIAAQTTNAGRAGGLSQGELQALLGQAGIGASVSGSASSGYHWRAGALSGSAAVRPISSTAEFPSYVQGAIAAAERACNGDFASIPSKQGPRFATYEVACVGSSGSTSSSILFYEKNGQAITIGHETAPENMDAAMDARDKLAGQILR